jgi:hypothetical protein
MQVIQDQMLVNLKVQSWRSQDGTKMCQQPNSELFQELAWLQVSTMTPITLDQLSLVLCGKLILLVVLDHREVANPVVNNDTRHEVRIIQKISNNYPRCAQLPDSLLRQCVRARLKMVIEAIQMEN